MDVETPAPTETTKPAHSFKRVTPLLIVAGLLLAIYFIPQLPAVRGWVLTQLVGAAQTAGYSLDYAAAGGNPWRGVRLYDAAVEGSGVKVRTEALELEYFLPALLTGSLPVSVTLEGVQGKVAFGELARREASGKGSSVTPVLRELTLKNAELELTDVPYTLPDLSVSNLQAWPAGNGFRAEATLQTSEGEADVNGTLSLTPLRFDFEVEQADARLARQWWKGITGGALTGTVSYRNDRLRAEASVEDGSLAFLGEAVTGVTGSAVYEDAKVNAELSGRALGGTVTATGGVDIAARRWFAEADGEVALRNAALWLARGRLPVDADLPLSGSARTRLRASGWRDVSLSGEADGAGSVAGYALDALEVDYGFGTDAGARVLATAGLAGGDVTARLTPRADGFSFDLKGGGIKLLPTTTADLSIDLTQAAGALSGTTDVGLTGSLLGEDLQVTLNGALNTDTLQAAVSGTALGGPVAGAASFQDGNLNGRLEVQEARLPVLKRPVGLELSLSGPPSALPLTFTLTTPEPTGLVLGPLIVPKDVSGQLSGTLRGARLEDLSGRLGTLSVAGDLALNLQNGSLRYSLKNTPLSGVVNGEASLEDGLLTFNDGVLSGQAELTSSRLRLPGGTLPPLDAAELSYRHAGTWTVVLTAPDESLALVYDGTSLRATAADYPVEVFGQSLELSGTSDFIAGDPLGSLDLRLTGRTPFGDVTLTGGTEELQFDLEASRLASGSRLAGTANLRNREVSLRGELGLLSVSGAGRVDAGNLSGTLGIRDRNGGDQLELRFGGNPAQPDLALNGRLPLDLIGDLFGLEATGTLEADLRQRGDRYEGGATVVGTLASVPVEVRARGDGGSLILAGNASPFSVPVDFSGQLRPTLELTAESDIGNFVLDESGRLKGEGTVPGGSFAGFELEPQAWALSGDLPGGAATLELPDTASRLSAKRTEDGWRANFDLAQTLTRGDSTLRLAAMGDLSADQSTLSGEVVVQTPAGDAALPFSGSLDGLELRGELPAPIAASLFEMPFALNGNLSVAAQAQLSDWLNYTATANWQTPDAALTARLEGGEAGFNVTAAGDGLDLHYTPENLTVEADGFQLEPFLAEGVEGSLSGTLRRTLEAGWAGALALEARAPVALTGVLNGAGNDLSLRATVEEGDLSATVDGTLLPTLDLALSGAFRGLANLQGQVGGTLIEPDLAATLTTQPLTLQNRLELSVPAQSVVLTADLAGGLNAEVQGDAFDLELAGGDLRGRLELPFAVAGEPQLFSAEVSGEVSNPALSGTLVGGVVSGPVTVEAGRLATTLQVDPSPLLNALPFTAPTLTLEFEGAPDLSWQAQLEGSAQVRGLPLALGGTFVGEGARYQGGGTVTLGSQSLPVSVTGQGGEVQADVIVEAFDLASLAPALPVSLTGKLGGEAHFVTSDSQPFSFDLTATGAAQGRSFDLTAALAEEGGLRVMGEVDGTSILLSDEAGAYLLSLGSDGNSLSLEGRLELSPTFSFNASGQYESQPITMTADYAPTSLATWAASVGNATLTGSALNVDNAWTLHSSAESPENGLLPTGRAEVTALVESGNVTLTALQASTTLAGRAFALELSGPAWPTPEVTGSLDVAGFGRSEVAMKGTGSADGAPAYSVALRYDELMLRAELSSSFSLGTVALDGEGTLPIGSGVSLVSDLAWSAKRGFSGKAEGVFKVGDFLETSFTAVGTGPLGVAGRARLQGEEVARLELVLSSNPFARPDLSGRLTLKGGLGTLSPAYEALTSAPTILTGNFDVAGEVADPRLGGSIALQGAVSAAGDFVWDGDDGRLSLSGEGLDATGEVDAAGWSFTAQADALELGDLLPQLATPRLDATLNGAGTWGETPKLTAERFVLQTPNGSLEGTVKYDGSFSGRLETNLAMADLRFGTALQGSVAGDLLVGDGADGPSLKGTLKASSLGLSGGAATLDGDLVVSGPLTVPDLSLNLRGAGAASGTLFANLQPRKGSYAVTSTLKVGKLTSDFAMSQGEAELVANGQVMYQDYAVAVSAMPSAGAAVSSLNLTGRGRLDGWVLELAPAASRLDLRGPLGGLDDTLAGQVALSASWPSGEEARLTGTLAEVSVGPVEIGDVTVNRSGGQALTLAGETLAATVTFQGGVTWTLERFAVELPGDLALEATGQGNLTSADLVAEVSGRVQDESFEFPTQLTYRQGTVTATSEAELFGGRLALDARGSAEGGWQGSLALTDISLGGATGGLTGKINGPLQTPELAAAMSLSPVASPETTFSGSVLASAANLELAGDLVSPFLDESLKVSGRLATEPLLILQTDGGERLELGSQDGLLTAAGALELSVGPFAVELAASPDAAAASGQDLLDLNLSVPGSGLAFTSTLPKVAPAKLAVVLAEGLVLQGTAGTAGSVVVRFDEELSAELRSLSLQTPDGSVSLSGRLAPRAGRLSGRWQGEAAETATLPWLASLTGFSFEAELAGDEVRVSAVGDDSYLSARYALGTQSGTLDAALALPAGSARAELSYDAEFGPSGKLTFTDFPLFSSLATGNARFDAALTLTPEALSGEAGLELADGSLALTGSLGLASVLPSSAVPKGSNEQNLTARFSDFSVENVPWVARALPFLSAPLTGEATLQNGEVSGQLAAPVTVAERVLPLRVTAKGTLGELELEGEVERSSFALTVSPGTVAGLVRFVDFPLDKAVGAVAGPSEVSSQLTGALRFEVPNGRLQDSYLRFASERFVLEEGGVVTEGDLSFELENGGLTVQKASFNGVGSWQASGEASRERLNLRFDARDADFGPLLRLVPQLAGLDVGAFGTVQLVTSGSLVNPVVRASSPELRLSLGGSAYRMSDTTVTVQATDFVTSGRIDGVAPLTGSLVFGGGGQVRLAAPRSFDLSLRFEGNPEVPVLGTLEGVEGTVSVRPGEPWQLVTTGVLGSPFEVTGSLSPLDLRLRGQNLNLRAPRFFLNSSVTDADLRFFLDDRFHLAGSLFVRQAELDLESRREAAQDTAAEVQVDSTEPEPASQGRSPFLARLSFDDLSLKAPQQLSFSENFGSGELGDIDLVLSGTAARPSLSGSARALRGTVRFAGRDFALQKAHATFEPAQGIYPTLDIAATTTFDKSQVLNGLADEVTFVEPQSGANFAVALNLSGGVEPNPEGPRPFKLDITPTLSSDAVIELGGAPGTRPLTEPELFSLLTLGKLELSPEFAQGGLATSLAQGALDTAIDFLILSELQRGLGDALGLDLLEIRTTPLGSLLTGESEPFGVSLRFGGYLSDEVFASYEIGSLGVGADVALRNAFNVRYTLDALEFNLAGRLDLYRDANFEPLPEIALNLGYAFSPLVRLETGVELSTAKQGVRFGVSLRW